MRTNRDRLAESSRARRAGGPTLEDPELVPLDDRWTLLQVVRLILVVFLLTGPLVAPASFTGTGSPQLSKTYVMCIIAVELFRRWTGRRALRLLGLSLLLDGIYLQLVLRGQGAEAEWMGLLLALHISAVTLLLSYRAGLKVTIWHTLLVVVAEVLLYDGRPYSTAPSWLAALWLVAITTAACSALNERELRRGRRELGGLAAMATAIEKEQSPAEVLSVALGHILATFRRTRGAVVLVTDSRPLIIGPDGETREHLDWDPLVQQCLSRRVPLLVRRLSPTDTGLRSVLQGASNLIAIPLSLGEDTAGVLVVEYGGNRFTTVPATLVARVCQFGDQVTLVLTKLRLHQELTVLASADGLTGIANRRSFDEAAARGVTRSQRSGEEVSFLIIDVDHFKAFNDTYGHLAGDQVLRVVASTVSAAVRPADLPARYGGEEFVVLLPGCDAGEALQVAERVREAIQAADTGVAPVTVSIGVSTLPADGRDAASAIAAADEALYHSKRGGRNRATHVRSLRHIRQQNQDLTPA